MPTTVPAEAPARTARLGEASGGGTTASRRRRPVQAAAREFDYDKAIQPDRERPASQPGAILRVTLDTKHWLSAGNDGETQDDDRGQSRVRAAQAEQRPQRRHLSERRTS